MGFSIIQDYFKRSGDERLQDGNKEENEHGFCIWRASGDSLILVHVYGDSNYWDKWADDKAKELGLRSIMFATKRNPGAFLRKYNYRVIGTMFERSAKWVA